MEADIIAVYYEILRYVRLVVLRRYLR